METNEQMDLKNIRIKSFYLNNPLKNINYLIYSSLTKEAIVVDPLDSKLILNFVNQEGLDLRYIAITHFHADHIGGLEDLIKTFPRAKVFREGILDLSHWEDGSVNIKWHGLNTPGHTMDSMSFLLTAEQRDCLFFVGDSLFELGVGNCKNGGNPELLYETIKALASSIDPKVRFFPGHDYFNKNLSFLGSLLPLTEEFKNKISQAKNRSTLEFEMEYNPFFLCFNKIWRDQLNTTCSEKDFFLELRKKRDQF